MTPQNINCVPVNGPIPYMSTLIAQTGLGELLSYKSFLKKDVKTQVSRGECGRSQGEEWGVNVVQTHGKHA